MGTTDHGQQQGLSDDDHPQYHTDARGDARYDALGVAAATVASHVAAADPHPSYTTVAEAAAAAPVQSVNGKAGSVTLSAGDISDLSSMYLSLSGGTLTGPLAITRDTQSPAYLITYADTFYPALFTRRGRGTQAAPSGVLANDALGSWLGQGIDAGGAVRNGVVFLMQATAEWSNVSAPARFLVQTTPTGSTSPVTRIVVDADGNTMIGTPAANTGERLQVNGDGYFQGNVNIKTTYVYKINNIQVVGARVPGWAAATGTAARTTFATSTVTTAQLAQRVKALIDDLIAHGLIGA